MQKAFSGLALTFTGLAGALSIGALKGAFDKYVDGAASMQKLAVITGSTTEKISGLSAVARLSGTDVGALEGGMVRLSAALTKADKESSSAGKAFATLELDPAKLRTMDTADALQAVAKSFAQIEDGSSKTALAVALFGKAGAELLPYLNDLANTGQIVAKITTEQGQAAKEYQLALRQMEAAQDAVAKTIVAEMLPAASTFVKTLADLVRGSNDVNGAVKSLASDGSIRAWAQSGAIAVANLIDAFQLLKKIAVEVATPIERVGRNVYTVGALAGIASSSGSLQEKQQAFDSLKKENEAYFAGLDKRLAENRKPADLFSDRIKKAFSATPAAVVAGAPKRKIQFTGDGDGSAASGGKGRAEKQIDDGSRLVESLRDQIRNTQALTEVEKLEAQIADGKYRTATAANLEIAKGYAQVLDNIAAARSAAEDELEIQRKRLEVFAEGARVFESVRTPIEALDAEIAKLMTLLDAGAISLETFGRAASRAGEEFQKISDDAEKTGAGLNAFAKSAAKNIQSAFADFLFDPFQNGTKSMLQSFGETVRRMVANAVAADLGKRLFGDLGKDGGGIGGLVGSGLSWLSGILPKFDVGSDYVPRDMAAIVHKGERIVPAAQNKPGALGGHSVSVVVNMGGNSGAADVRRSGGAVAREVLGALSAAGRYR
jgi:division protein CdvB (Snf7/Vps24/ESCRT-III family)